MSVTDLTNTVWYFNNNLQYTGNHTYDIASNINFTSNNQEFKYFEYYDEEYGYLFYTYLNGSDALVVEDGEWSEVFQTITITGGTDVTNNTFIDWMYNNATLISPEPQPIRPDFYKVTDLELTSIADAIRSKASISESLTFPDEFISEIEDIGGYCNISVNDYCNRTYTSVEAGVSAIGPGTFYRHSSLTTASFPNCTTISDYAFYSCSSLTTISFPNCTSIGSNVFANCSLLTTVSFPNCISIGSQAFAFCFALTSILFSSCTSIGRYAFGYCSTLTSISFPSCNYIGQAAFGECDLLTAASFPNCTEIGGYAFGSCFNLISLNFTGILSVPSLTASNAFISTPIAGYSASAGQYGSIFVPSSLLTSFKTATNWTYFSDRMVGV